MGGAEPARRHGLREPPTHVPSAQLVGQRRITSRAPALRRLRLAQAGSSAALPSIVVLTRLRLS
jgi:hypothetical protein